MEFTCRVLRLSRRGGNLYIDVRLLQNGPPSNSANLVQRVKTMGATMELARFRCPIPAYLGRETGPTGPDARVQLTAVAESRRSSTMSGSRSVTSSDAGGSRCISPNTSAPIDISRTISDSGSVPVGRRFSISRMPKLEGATVSLYLSSVESTEVFKVKHCSPREALGRNEWEPRTERQWKHVWTSPWTDACLVHRAQLLRALHSEMKHDAILMFQTLFVQNLKAAPWMPREDEEAHDRRILFMKRLILCLASCKLLCCTEENSAQTKSWPFPLASALCHGGRIMFRLDGVRWDEFLNFLLFGNEETHNWSGDEPVPSPLWARWAATHGIGLHRGSCRLYERRLKLTNTIKNIKDGLLSHHLAMDLPVGGAGNRAPSAKRHGELYIGPAGVPYKRTQDSDVDEYAAHFSESLQHGHLYIRWDDFGHASMPVLSSGDSRTTAEQSASTASSTKPQSVSTPLSSSPDMGVDAGEEEWSHITGIRNRTDLESVLHEHGVEMGEDEKRHQAIRWLHNLLMKDEELALHSNTSGKLRCRGILILLVFEMEEDGVEKVLVHEEAEARKDEAATAAHEKCFATDRSRNDRRHLPTSAGGRAAESATMCAGPLVAGGALVDGLRQAGDTLVQAGGVVVESSVVVVETMAHTVGLSRQHSSGSDAGTPSEGGLTVQDERVVTAVRRRHESWHDAVLRCCQCQLKLSSEASQKVIKRCRKAMDGLGQSGGELSIFKCAQPSTVCHHHSVGFSHEELPLEYLAYRFVFPIKASDLDFNTILWPDFETVENGLQLRNFGGSPEHCIGSITRKYSWVPRAEAEERRVAGLIPPEGRLHIVRERCRLSALLMGIENSAPHKEDLFGGKHTAAGVSKDSSPWGGRKWREYRKAGQEVPADLGGMLVHIDEVAFRDYTTLCRRVPLCKPSQGYQADFKPELRFFKTLMTNADEDIDLTLRDYTNVARAQVMHKTGTRVLDDNVRERPSERRLNGECEDALDIATGASFMQLQNELESASEAGSSSSDADVQDEGISI